VRAFIHHLAYDFRTGIRDRSKLLMFYLFPLVFFGLMGGLMSSVNPGFMRVIVPGMVLFAVMCASLLSLPSVLVTARESGVFRSFRINGVPVASILGVPVISTAVHMLVIAVVISFAGARAFGGTAPASIPGFAAAALLTFAAFSGIGALIGVAAGNITVTILLSQLIYIPSIVLGGIMVPVSILPAALQRAALLLPATHCMNLFSGIAMPGGQGVPWLSAAVLGASVILSFGLAALLFEWDSRASQPSRKAWLALFALAPFAVAAALGG
jgi:ABC-2 type transport system permease protein